MTTRLLPRDEWVRLAGTELETVWPHLPTSADVLVVEDAAGSIVACWATFLQRHVEGCWIAPAHRGRAGVARALLSGMRRLARACQSRTLATAATTDDVRRLLEGLGAIKLPGDHYVLTVE